MTGQIRVQVSPTEIRLSPGGAPSTMRVTVFNGTNIVEEVWAGASQAKEWLTSEPAFVRLLPEQQGSVELSLTIPAGRVVPAGAYPLTIRVASAATRQVILDQQVQLTVATVIGAASLRIEPSEVRGGKHARFALEVTQTGNAPLEVSFTGEDAQGALVFSFSPPAVAVPPLGAARAVCTVSARRSYFGGDLVHRFSVCGQGSSSPLQSSGVFHQSAALGPTTMRRIAVALTMIGGLVALVAALVPTLHWTRLPSLGGLQWNYSHFARRVFPTFMYPPRGLDQPFLQKAWASGGALVAILAVLAIVGALVGRRRLSALSALLIIVAMLVFLAGLQLSPHGAGLPSIGVVLAILGGSVALVGSLFVRPLGQDISIPKLPRQARLPGKERLPMRP